jgi:hypothetical protein
LNGNVVSDEPGAITQFTPLAGRLLERFGTSSDADVSIGDTLAPAAASQVFQW